jgi:transposase
MRDTALYAQILGVLPPWRVVEVELHRETKEVTVRLSRATTDLRCPVCEKPVPGYDSRTRRWRHLDTCQYRTLLEADVPRVKCDEHGVRLIPVPWAEDRARFTALFEALVIDWLLEAPISAVAEQLQLSWAEVDGIMQRAVARGLARRAHRSPEAISVDETSFQKHHEYVTVVTDYIDGAVLHVADGHDGEALKTYYTQLAPGELEELKLVVMDMSKAYISATREMVPDAEQKLCFDKFHLARSLGDAVDKVRRQEHKRLLQAGDERLKGTKYFWLENPTHMSEERWAAFEALRRASRTTARAWALKEAAMGLWDYRTEQEAREGWRGWYNWAIRSRLEPIKRVARTVKRHLQGILNAVVHKVSNGIAEGVNSVIQRLKYQAHGYRNRARFRNAIYFHCGHLELYPASLGAGKGTVA